jgi:hypothetical protein
LGEVLSPLNTYQLDFNIQVAVDLRIAPRSSCKKPVLSYLDQELLALRASSCPFKINNEVPYIVDGE